jgi:transposase-like protein
MTRTEADRHRVFPNYKKGTPMSGGRPSFEPDDKQRLVVTTLAACGTRFALIAKHIGVDAKTLRRYFRKELNEGHQDANALVARSLFGQAIAGNTTAQIFWLKTRAGWRETAVVQNQLLDRDGNPVDQPKLGISFSDGGPGLPLAQKLTITFDEGDTNEQSTSCSEENARSILR